LTYAACAQTAHRLSLSASPLAPTAPPGGTGGGGRRQTAGGGRRAAGGGRLVDAGRHPVLEEREELRVLRRLHLFDERRGLRGVERERHDALGVRPRRRERGRSSSCEGHRGKRGGACPTVRAARGIRMQWGRGRRGVHATCCARACVQVSGRVAAERITGERVPGRSRLSSAFRLVGLVGGHERGRGTAAETQRPARQGAQRAGPQAPANGPHAASGLRRRRRVPSGKGSAPNWWGGGGPRVGAAQTKDGRGSAPTPIWKSLGP